MEERRNEPGLADPASVTQCCYGPIGLLYQPHLGLIGPKGGSGAMLLADTEQELLLDERESESESDAPIGQQQMAKTREITMHVLPVFPKQ